MEPLNEIITHKRRFPIKDNESFCKVRKVGSDDESSSDRKPILYTIENIESFFFDPKNKNLLYVVKWESLPESRKSFEHFNQVCNSKAFQNFVSRFSASFQDDIELNDSKLQEKLQNRINDFLTKPKSVIKKAIENFNWQEFESYRSIAQVYSPFKSFYEKYEELFFLHHFAKLDRDQHDKFRRLLIDIQKREGVTVSFVNDVDFTYPNEFTYVTDNVFSGENQQEAQEFKPTKAEIYLLEVFKTNLKGWGLKILANVKKGALILDCFGEVLAEVEAADRDNKTYFLPVKSNDRKTSIDSLNFGNLSRFINHSCSPNASFELTAETSIQVTAIRDIVKGEEITVDYSESDIAKWNIDCHCDSENCMKVF